AFTPSCFASALHRSTSKPTISRVFGSGAANGGTSAKVAQRSSLRCWMSCHWSARTGVAAPHRARAARARRVGRICMGTPGVEGSGSMRAQVRQEPLRARMLRLLEERLGLGDFEDRAGVHEPDAVGDLARETHL